MENKICKKCGELKPLSEYYPQKETRDRLFAHCKICACLLAKEYRIQNKDAITEARRKYQAEHKDAARRWHAENKDARNEAARKLYFENIEANKERAGKYRAENKDQIIKKYEERKMDPELHKKDIASRLEYNRNHLEERRAYVQIPEIKERIRIKTKEYRLKNIKRINKREREYMRLQVILNTNFAKSCKLRNMINTALKRYNVIKSEKSEMLLGCKVIDAVGYLVSLGYDRAIHDIDHIVPVGRFDMNNEVHRLVAFNYKNLQPLEISENRAKQKKLIDGWKKVIINICKSLNIESIGILNHITGTIKEVIA